MHGRNSDAARVSGTNASVRDGGGEPNGFDGSNGGNGRLEWSQTEKGDELEKGNGYHVDGERDVVRGGNIGEERHRFERVIEPSIDKKENGEQRPRNAAAKERAMAFKSRTGGVYIPPFKLRKQQDGQETEKDGEADQRRRWEALKKSLTGFVNRVSATNIRQLVPEILEENLIRGRGLFARSVLRAQLASPTLTDIFAALVAIVNSRIPIVGDLVVRRLVANFQRGHKRNDKIQCTSCLAFIAHLVNQRVIQDVLALEICTILLDTPTTDGVSVCCAFLQDCGPFLLQNQPAAFKLICDRLKDILTEGEVERNAQYAVEKLLDARRSQFDERPSVRPELDLIDEDDQTAHMVDLLGDISKEELLDVFRLQDPKDFAKENAAWRRIKRSLLNQSAAVTGEEAADHSGSEGKGGDGSDGSDAIGSDGSVGSKSGSDGSDVDIDSEEEFEKAVDEGRKEQTVIRDLTEMELVKTRKVIYLTIMSSATYEECVHKLVKLNLAPGQEFEVASMLADCCSMERTFSTYFALQAQRLCELRPAIYRPHFEALFVTHYSHAHRLEANKIRNLAKFFALLLSRDGISFDALSVIKLNATDTTAAGRIFLKLLFQSLCDNMGLERLEAALKQPELQPHIQGLLPTAPDADHADIRFSFTFFAAIGLASLAGHLNLAS